MADIVFRYSEMQTCANTIRDTIKAGYTSAASTFQDDFAQAIGSWEGDSKEKMQQFISGPVNEYMATTIPELLEAFAQLLEFNAKSMQDADRQIADAIPTSLSS